MNQLLARARRHLARRRHAWAAQRGMTLIELSIAVLISSILVGFVFAIYSRMGAAYRAQATASQVNQGLRGARELIARDVRAAGHMIPLGFQVNQPVLDAFNTATGLLLTNPIPPIVVVNGADGTISDSLHLFYAGLPAIVDAGGSHIISVSPSLTSVVVEGDGGDFDPFSPDVRASLALIVSNKRLVASPIPGKARIAEFDACLVRITAKNFISFSPPQTELTFDVAGAPYNTATNDHCKTPIGGAGTPIPAAGATVWAFTGRAYRTSPGARDVGLLQRSLTGGIEDDWTSLALGIVDMQVARRIYEVADSNGDLDGDGDTNSDWYASGSPSNPTVNPPPLTLPPAPQNVHLIELSVSLLARTIRQVSGSGTAQIPFLTTGANPSYNPVGDADSAVDPETMDEYRGNHIFRASSMRIDIRNVGVGQ